MGGHRRLIAYSISLGLVLLVGAVSLANGAWDWMPKGGDELLKEILARPESGLKLQDIASASRSRDEWRSYLQSLGDLVAGMTDKEQETLAAYLASTFPLAGGSLPSGAQGAVALPPGGRELMLTQCQLCHSIATPVQLDLDEEGWYGTLSTIGPHGGLPLTPKQRERIVQYAAINFPLSPDEIPPELQVPLPRY